jgi:hypothetical protein
LKIAGTVTLNGTGKLTFSNSGDGYISTNGSAATLNNNGTIVGAGGISDAMLTLNNGTGGLIEATGSHGLFIATNTLVNGGTLESNSSGGMQILSAVTNNGKVIADAGVIAFQDTLAGSGSLTIGGSGEIDLGSNDAGLAMGTTFAAGAAGTLQLGAVPTSVATSLYDGTISGFGINDAIDLFQLSYGTSMTVAAHFAGGVTTVTVGNGTDTVALKFAGNIASDTFVLGDDGEGGTRLTDPPANVALFGSYMASMFAGTSGQVGAPTAETVQNPAALHAHTG